jgi:hypothetical protein
MKTKEEIVNLINSAFEGVVLGKGISLNQSKIIDNYGRGCTDEEFGALPDSETTDNWQEIPLKELDDADCIAHMDYEGIRYYIPALMIRLLDNYDACEMMSIGTLSFLYPYKDYWNSRMSMYGFFADQQRFAMASYLKALPNLVELKEDDLARVRRAIERYWNEVHESNGRHP